jgi:hypothetical protein
MNGLSRYLLFPSLHFGALPIVINNRLCILNPEPVPPKFKNRGKRKRKNMSMKYERPKWVDGRWTQIVNCF